MQNGIEMVIHGIDCLVRFKLGHFGVVIEIFILLFYLMAVWGACSER